MEETTQAAQTAQTAQAEQATEKRFTITLDNNEYFVDTLPEEAKTLLNHIQIIDDEITRLQTQKSISDIAKQKLIDDLSKITDQFEKIPENSEGN